MSQHQQDLFAAQDAAAHERLVRRLVAAAKREWQIYAEAVTERLLDGQIEKTHALDLMRSKLQRESKKFFARFPCGWLWAMELEGRIWDEHGPLPLFQEKTRVFFPPLTAEQWAAGAPPRKAVSP